MCSKIFPEKKLIQDVNKKASILSSKSVEVRGIESKKKDIEEEIFEVNRNKNSKYSNYLSNKLYLGNLSKLSILLQQILIKQVVVNENDGNHISVRLN